MLWRPTRIAREARMDRRSGLRALVVNLSIVVGVGVVVVLAMVLRGLDEFTFRTGNLSYTVVDFVPAVLLVMVGSAVFVGPLAIAAYIRTVLPRRTIPVAPAIVYACAGLSSFPLALGFVVGLAAWGARMALIPPDFVERHASGPLSALPFIGWPVALLLVLLVLAAVSDVKGHRTNRYANEPTA
jgi:hypothetical protein